MPKDKPKEPAWTDPDDAPEITDDVLDKATFTPADKSQGS